MGSRDQEPIEICELRRRWRLEARHEDERLKLRSSRVIYVLHNATSKKNRQKWRGYLYRCMFGYHTRPSRLSWSCSFSILATSSSASRKVSSHATNSSESASTCEAYEFKS